MVRHQVADQPHFLERFIRVMNLSKNWGWSATWCLTMLAADQDASFRQSRSGPSTVKKEPPGGKRGEWYPRSVTYHEKWGWSATWELTVPGADQDGLTDSA